MPEQTLAGKKRRPWATALLIGAGVVAFGCLLLVGKAAYWWQENGARIGQEVQAARQDGKAAASATDYQGCLNQAAARVSALSGSEALIVGNSFLGGCMETAAKPPGFCDVPSDVFGIRSWRQKRCEAVPVETRDSCALLIGSVQQLCKARPSQAVNAPSRLPRGTMGR